MLVVNVTLNVIMFLTLMILYFVLFMVLCVFFFQAEDGIRGVLGSRGLGDVYKRQCTTTGVSTP